MEMRLRFDQRCMRARVLGAATRCVVRRSDRVPRQPSLLFRPTRGGLAVLPEIGTGSTFLLQWTCTGI